MASKRSKSGSKPKSSKAFTSKSKSRPKTARTGKPAPSAEPDGPTGGASAARQLIPAKDIKYLAGYAIECLNKSGHITSELGQEISTYTKKGLDAQAFRMALRLLRMGQRDPIKLRSLLDNRAYYEEVLDIDSIAATKLPFEDEPKKRSRKKKPDQIDLSERKDIDSETGGAEVHSLDEHRQEREDAETETAAA